METFLKRYVLLYADDTIVLAETPEDLQIALNNVFSYCKKLYLSVNTSKTKVVIFFRGKVRSHPDFLCGDSVLDVVQDYIGLGTIINYNVAFNIAISKQVSQARRAMFAMSIKARKLQLSIAI